nr:MAG TPA: YoaP-like protein [Bacteriophage sp.]
MMRRITEINGEIIVVETMIIVEEIVLITVQINGELVRYEILSVRQLWEGR